MTLTVGVVGARKVVQGIGAYVARAFRTAGCEVTGVVGTSPASVEAARADLRASYGIEAAGFTDLRALLEARRPDVLAICSPTAVHRPLSSRRRWPRVHACATSRRWEEDVGSRRRAEARSASWRRLARGRRLELNAQWPVTPRLPQLQLAPPAALGGDAALPDRAARPWW
jgi:hypothetical protein